MFLLSQDKILVPLLLLLVLFGTCYCCCWTQEDDEYAGDYENEVDQNQNYVQPPAPALGRPHANNHNGRALPQVRDHDHLPKLKLNIPPFEGRYVPDIYLTWELETEQRFKMFTIS